MRKQKAKSREKVLYRFSLKRGSCFLMESCIQKQRLREEKSQKEGMTQEMKQLEEKLQNDKKKWEEERENARKELAERENQLDRETRENKRLMGSISGLEERILLLEKKLQQTEQEKQTMVADFAERQGKQIWFLKWP